MATHVSAQLRCAVNGFASTPSLHGRAVSGLTHAARPLLRETLAACVPERVASCPAQGGGPSILNAKGSWASVRGQAAGAAAWRTHPFAPSERLDVVKALGARARELDLGGGRQYDALCRLYDDLLLPDSLFKPRSDGTGKCAVVRVGSERDLTAACVEAARLLLSGHTVSLLAPDGSARDAIGALAEGFPAALLQATEDAPVSEMPAVVSSFHCTADQAPPCQLWAERPPPRHFGGTMEDGHAHGEAVLAGPLALARTDIQQLAASPRSRYELTAEASDLLALLSTATASEVPSAPGLPPPRWSRSEYDRGVEEIHDLLDLLWCSHEPVALEEDSAVVAWGPAAKHLVLTVGSDIPGEVARAAVVAAMSPFRERVVLHAVGLGARGLAKDPLRGFCRLVQSGRSNLEWQIQEHETWADLFVWLQALSETSAPGPAGEGAQPPMVFGSLHGMEAELHRAVAATGGVAWPHLFPPEPLEQLRRWCRPIVYEPGVGMKEQAEVLQQIRGESRAAPPVQVVRPPAAEDD